MNPNANQIKNEKGYPLRTPRYDRIYLFYERGNTIHGYRFINEDNPPEAAKDMLFAYRDKYTQVRMTVSRFDYLFRRQLFAIEKLKEPTDYSDGRHFENERHYTKEQLDSLITNIDDIEF